MEEEPRAQHHTAVSCAPWLDELLSRRHREERREAGGRRHTEAPLPALPCSNPLSTARIGEAPPRPWRIGPDPLDLRRPDLGWGEKLDLRPGLV